MIPGAGWEASFSWLTASPVTQPCLLLSPPPAFPLLSFLSLSALLSQLLTFSVTGWKGLQDQPSGPQGNSDLSGPVAEQGLGRGMQAQINLVSMHPHINSLASCPCSCPNSIFCVTNVQQGLGNKDLEHS